MTGSLEDDRKVRQRRAPERPAPVGGSAPPSVRPVRVLIASDCLFAWEAHSRLEDDGRFAVCAHSREAAEAVRETINTRPELALIAVDLQGGGIAAAREILARLPRLTVVMIADDGSKLVAALRAGAEGYLLRDMSLERLPQILWEAASGTSAALPRALMKEILSCFRDPNALRRTLVDGEALTSREWQILSLLRQGFSTAQVSRRLSISVATVRSHRRRIRRKIQSIDPAA